LRQPTTASYVRGTTPGGKSALALGALISLAIILVLIPGLLTVSRWGTFILVVLGFTGISFLISFAETALSRIRISHTSTRAIGGMGLANRFLLTNAERINRLRCKALEDAKSSSRGALRRFLGILFLELRWHAAIKKRNFVCGDREHQAVAIGSLATAGVVVNTGLAIALAPLFESQLSFSIIHCIGSSCLHFNKAAFLFISSTVPILLFGKILPKYLAIANPDRVVVAWPIYRLMEASYFMFAWVHRGTVYLPRKFIRR
jgi:hypothetical protein